MNTHNTYRQVRLDKLENIKKLGMDPYPSSYVKSHDIINLLENYSNLESGEVTSDVVSVAGRIMSLRNNGMFIDLCDDKGKIQIFSHKDNLSENYLNLLSYLDIGDIIGIKGIIRRTPRGELTINSQEITFLSKALLTLPEKYHGLTDVEIRYRHREIDLIVNEESREILKRRSKIISMMRQYLIEQDFLEVETPMLHSIAGGALAKPFVTHHNSLDIDLFLRIAPELYLKRLIIGGVSEKLFEINRCFRNEGVSTRHNPEFTSIEIYESYKDFNRMMSLTEEIILFIIEKIGEAKEINYQDKIINFNSWEKRSMSDLVLDATGIDFMEIKTDQEARDIAKRLHMKIEETYGWGKVLEAIFAEKVEENLINPTHVTHLPTEISPLAKVCSYDSRITERFETYINGWEIANGFSELNDPIDQRERFMAQVQDKSSDDDIHPIDEDFITALEHAMPPLGGLGIGIDRLVMILTNSDSIREVIAFPTLKPIS